MATSKEFIDFIVDQLHEIPNITYKKMFGEYMIYFNLKPLLLICDDTVFVKIKDEIKHLLEDAETGYPYNGAKLHYILDIENVELAKEVLQTLEPITPLPKTKKPKAPK